MPFTELQRVRMLYKAILRLHKDLPPRIKALGDEYVKSEFKRHKNCSKGEANLFMNEWTDYALTMSKQLSLSSSNKSDEYDKLGLNMDQQQLDQMRDEQIAQLYELMKAAKVGDSG